MTSPIERLVDSACGLKSDKGKNVRSVNDDVVEAMLQVIDSAIIWSYAETEASRKNLYVSVKRLQKLGW